jgi:membrane-associated phospholipid phosphatase
MMNSMPSGDSLQSANFAMMMILYFENNIKFLSLLFIPMSMTGRVFYCCHYWFDCIIGAFFGIFISFGCYFLINKFNLNKF